MKRLALLLPLLALALPALAQDPATRSSAEEKTHAEAAESAKAMTRRKPTKEQFEAYLQTLRPPLVLVDRDSYRQKDQALWRRHHYEGANGTAPVVDGALAWLRSQQRADGSWPGEPAVASTSLALLAHVVHSDLPGDGTAAGEAVRRGFEFLLSDLDPETGLFRAAGAEPLAQPLGALALAEAAGMTLDARLAAAAAAALRALAAGQRLDGAWNADPRDPSGAGEGDVAATVWCVLALRASTTWRFADLPSDALDAALARALDALESLVGPESPRRPAGGVFPDPAAAAAAFALFEGCRTSGPAALRLADAIEPFAFDLDCWDSLRPSDAWNSPMEECFFLANAKIQSPRPRPFADWSKRMASVLPEARVCSNRTDRGAPCWWDSPSEFERGLCSGGETLPCVRRRHGGRFEGTTTAGDRVRDTSFAAFSLMVWYAWARSENTWWNSVINPPPPPAVQRTDNNGPVLVRSIPHPAPATNAPAAPASHADSAEGAKEPAP